MKILVALDESPHAKEAARWVARLGWPAGSSVLLLSSVRSDLYVTGELYVPSSSELELVINEDVKRAEEIVAAAAPELKQRGLHVETRITRGDPRFSIVDEAKAWGAELVVMGSHGRTGLSRLFLGSVASHVTTHGPCSVLVAKLPAA
jgi:nucleotide-binding universal stress UspA family protein